MQERWASCGVLTTPGFGSGLSLEEADAVAHTVKPEDVSAYTDAVLAEVIAWLDTLSDDDLDTVPNWHAYIAEYPQYNVPGIVDAPRFRFVWSNRMEKLRQKSVFSSPVCQLKMSGR